jgi:hypothetical protein
LSVLTTLKVGEDERISSFKAKTMLSLRMHIGHLIKYESKFLRVPTRGGTKQVSCEAQMKY